MGVMSFFTANAQDIIARIGLLPQLADGIGDTGNVIGSEVLIDASAPTVSSKMNYRAHAQTPHSVWIMVRVRYTRNTHSATCRHQHSPFGQMVPAMRKQ